MVSHTEGGPLGSSPRVLKVSTCQQEMSQHDLPLSVKLLCVLGNDVINRIYEAQCSEGGPVKPRADSLR